MAFRFRKSVKIAPGVRVNLGKKNASVSMGVKGAGITMGTAGTTIAASVPGTGIGYRRKISSKRSTHSNQTPSSPRNLGDAFRVVGLLASVCGIFFPPILLVSLPAVVLGSLYTRSKERRFERALVLQAAALDLSEAVDRMNKAKTLTPQIRHCNDAIGFLATVNELDPRGRTVGQQKELRRQLLTRLRVMPFLDSFDKAELKYLEGDYTTAAKHGQKAASLLQDKAVTDKDLKLIDARTAHGKPLTKKVISRVLAETHKRAQGPE